MTGNKLNSVATNIENFGEFIEKNYGKNSLSDEKIAILLQEWDISQKTFNRLFCNYKTIESREEIKLENKQALFGADNGRSIKVKNTVTGKTYSSITDAAKELKVNKKTLQNNMRKTTNNYPVSYVER